MITGGMLGDVRYALLSIHGHWSGGHIVDGVSYNAEIHVIFLNVKNETLDMAFGKF